MKWKANWANTNLHDVRVYFSNLPNKEITMKFTTQYIIDMLICMLFFQSYHHSSIFLVLSKNGNLELITIPYIFYHIIKGKWRTDGMTGMQKNAMQMCHVPYYHILCYEVLTERLYFFFTYSTSNAHTSNEWW